MDVDNSQTARPLCRDTAERLIADDSVDLSRAGMCLTTKNPVSHAAESACKAIISLTWILTHSFHTKNARRSGDEFTGHAVNLQWRRQDFRAAGAAPMIPA